MPWVKLLGHYVESRKECKSTYDSNLWVLDGSKYLHQDQSTALGRVGCNMAREEGG